MVAKELAAPPRMSVAALREKYAEVFGEATSTGNRTWLLREQIERDIRVYEDYLLADHYGIPMTARSWSVGREVVAKRRGLGDVLQDDAARRRGPGTGRARGARRPGRLTPRGRTGRVSPHRRVRRPARGVKWK